ncbi:MAG: HAMP domain-containing protein [Candidatus Riflebacteria bacterium]|nr:HAMP domain-containing protein [Candidatus Riflebacteria bacterium]
MPLSMNKPADQGFSKFLWQSGFRFFRKIFLWFWLTILVVVIALVGTAFFLQEEAENPPFKGSLETMTRNLGNILVHFLEHSTPEEIQPLGQIFSPRGVWLMTDDGQMVFSTSRSFNQARSFNTEKMTRFPLSPPRHLSDEAVIAHSKEFLKKKQSEISETIANREVFFQKIVAKSGKTYVVAQDFPHDFPRDRRVRMLFIASSPYAIFAVFLFVTTSLCLLLARSLATPILELRAASKRFSEGELQVRVSPKVSNRNDELGDLALDFNEMAEHLEIMIGRQKTLFHEISHELRSPLARMKVALELIRKKNTVFQEKMFDRLEMETDRLEELIKQILTLTKLEDKAWDIEPEEVNLSKLVEKILIDARFEAGNQDEKIILRNAEKDSLWVMGKEGLLSRALENVIRNALKFSPPDFPVLISLSIEGLKDGKKVLIKVSDRGGGVSPENLLRIFEPFYRCEEDRSRKTGGIGLGLAITKRSIERLGGKVFAENLPEGGLMVTLVLPLVSEPEAKNA